MINPQYILCGNTSGYLPEGLRPDNDPADDTAFFYMRDNMTIIDYWHPANQYPDALCYYALCALMQKSLIAKDI